MSEPPAMATALPRRDTAFDWITQNPAFAVTALYLVISAFGAALQALTFAGLGLNFFDYAQPSDFFVAAFRRPDASWSIVIYAGIFLATNMPLYWAMRHPERVSVMRGKRWARWFFSEKRVERFHNRAGALTGLFVGFIMMVMGVAVGRSISMTGKIQGGRGQYVRLELLTGNKIDDLIFVGTTNQFLITYDPREERASAWILGGLRRIEMRDRQIAPEPTE